MSDLFTPVSTPDALWDFLHEHLGLTVPRRPVCRQHQAPFDYLCRTYFEPAADVVVVAPRGGGKTRLGAVATLLDLLHKPGVSVRILGGSLDQSMCMWDHLIADIERLVPDCVVGKATRKRIALDNGSSASILPQSQRAVRGQRVQKLRCDEVDMFNEPVWEAAQLITRTLRSPTGAPLAAGTVEAVSTHHRAGGLMGKVVESAVATDRPVLRWCILDVLERCPPERDCKTCPLWSDCRGRAKTDCQGFVTIDDAVNMKRRVSVETWDAEMLCRRPRTRGSVFPRFARERHVTDLPRGVTPRDLARASWSLGIDFGFANPFVCLWVAEVGALDGDTGRPCAAAFVVDEYVQAEQTVDRHLVEIEHRGHPRARWIGCDPAGAARDQQTARSNVQVLQSAGYLVRQRQTRIVDGIEALRAALCPAEGPVTLFIHPRCTKLILAMEAYRYDGGGSEVPLKDGTHDHLIDALRYWMMNRTGKTKSSTY